MTTISFKIPDNEAAQLRQQAKAKGITVSEFIRRKVSKSKNKKRIQEYLLCEFTGAKILKGQPGDVPLTNESVGEMLADFP